MGSESVASCPQPLPVSPVSPLPKKNHTLQNTVERIPNKGACFYCNEEGHWVRDCPRRSNPSPDSGGPPLNCRSHPELQCPCGHGVCIVLTSRTSKNPGRDFYRCPAKQKSEQCGFFKWCDEAAYGHIPKNKNPMQPYPRHDGTNSPMKPACQIGLKSPVKHEMQFKDADLSNPICSCGAGKCITLTMADGENPGRKYFACPIKKGQGACNHFQWYDSTTKPIQTKHYDSLPEKPKLPILGNPEAGKAIYIAKAEDTVAPVSPLLTCNHFQWYDSTTKPIQTKHYDGLPEKPKLPILGNPEGGKAIYIAKAEDMVAPVSPLRRDPLSPKASVKEREVNNVLQFSPLKRLSLHEAGQGFGVSKHVRCMKLGGEVHWSNEFSSSPTSPCFRCGRFGHSKNNCPA